METSIITWRKWEVQDVRVISFECASAVTTRICTGYTCDVRRGLSAEMAGKIVILSSSGWKGYEIVEIFTVYKLRVTFLFRNYSCSIRDVELIFSRESIPALILAFFFLRNRVSVHFLLVLLSVLTLWLVVQWLVSFRSLSRLFASLGNCRLGWKNRNFRCTVDSDKKLPAEYRVSISFVVSWKLEIDPRFLKVSWQIC